MSTIEGFSLYIILIYLNVSIEPSTIKPMFHQYKDQKVDCSIIAMGFSLIYYGNASFFILTKIKNTNIFYCQILLNLSTTISALTI